MSFIRQIASIPEGEKGGSDMERAQVTDDLLGIDQKIPD